MKIRERITSGAVAAVLALGLAPSLAFAAEDVPAVDLQLTAAATGMAAADDDGSIEYTGDSVSFIAEDGKAFGMFKAQPGTMVVKSSDGTKVKVTYRPKNTTTYAKGFYLDTLITVGADDRDSTKLVSWTDDSFVFELDASQYCGKAVPVSPVKADDGTTSSQYYLAIPALDKISSNVSLVDGTWNLNLSSSLSMVKLDNAAFPSYAVVNGDDAYLVLNYCSSKGSAYRYGQVNLGKYEDQSKDVDGVIGTPIFKSGKTPSDGFSDDTISYYQFVLPVSKADLEAALNGEDGAELYYTMRYVPGYDADHDGIWYKASKDYYFKFDAYNSRLTSDSTALPTETNYAMRDYDIATSFGMFGLQTPADIYVYGDNAYVVVTSHTYDGQGAPKYDAVYLGKRTERTGSAPTTEETADLIMGIPNYVGTDEAAKYQDETGKTVYDYSFVLPMSTADLNAKLADNKAEDIYFIARYSEHYTNAKGETKLAGQWSGKADHYFTLETVEAEEQTYNIAEGQIVDIPDQTYTGKMIEPELTVTIHGKTLVKGTDYKVSYYNNVNAGTAKAIVTGMGTYTGALEKEFKIVKAESAEPVDIAKASIAAIAKQTYTGKAIEPALEVTYSGTALEEGTDYTAAYADNVQPGTATVTITGKGGYTGTATATFEVVAQNTDVNFQDVPEGSWFHDYVYEAAKMGIVGGYEPTRFGAGDNVTRAQVATMLYRYVVGGTATTEEADYADNETKFSDVESGKYYTAAINWANEIGLMTGDGNGKTMRPNDNITRQEMAVMLARFADMTGAVNTANADPAAFNKAKDTASVSDWAVDALKWTAANNILSGKDIDGAKYIDPWGNAKREEAAKMLVVLFQEVL